MKKNILFCFFFVALFFSCGEEQPRYTVPWALVDFTIDIENNKEDRPLKDGGGVKTYIKTRLAIDRGVGFGGLLVINSGRISTQGLPILYAYDLGCPNEDGRLSRVVPESGGISAICPTCKSEYAILIGTGHVMAGPSKKQLQSYQIHPTNAYGRYRITH